MTKRELPEGRKPLSASDSAALVKKMHDKLASGFTAGDRIAVLEELYEAAKQDAKEAEAYAAELEAKLAKAVLSLRRLSTSECFGSGEVLGLSLSDSPLGREVLARMDYALATIAELKGETDE